MNPLRSWLASFAAYFLCLSLTLTPVAYAQAGPQQVDKQYVLRFGDSLNMKVVENDKLVVQDQPIRPDGRISLPLIGEVHAGGLTLPVLTERVTKAYGKFFVDPHVVINVAHFRPLDVSVVGMVLKPGIYHVKEPVTLLQALALGGGYDPQRADLNNVMVLRQNGEVRKINVYAVLEGKVEDNVVIYDGDTVRVSEVGTPDWYKILPPLASALSIASTIVILLTRN